MTDSVKEADQNAVELEVVPFDVLDEVLYGIGQVLHVMSEVGADTEQLLDGGEELGTGE